MQGSEFTFQINMITGRAGDISCAASPSAHGIDRRMGGGEHARVLALPQIIIRAPDHDPALRAVLKPQTRVRKASLFSPNVGEHAIAPFLADLIHGGLKSGGVLIAHRVYSHPWPRGPEKAPNSAILSHEGVRSRFDAWTPPCIARSIRRRHRNNSLALLRRGARAGPAP